VWLGVQALAARPRAEGAPPPGPDVRPTRVVFWQAFLTDLLNPKVGIFFLAFLPQFVSVHAPHRTAQLALLGATVNVIALLINIPLVFVATRVSERLRGNGATALRLTRAMGVVFIALGLRVVFA
jgi:threonine/homoserine/homoserine lactone efflux protein